MDRPQAILAGLAGGLLLLSVLLVLPFLEFFLLAIVLAYPLRPLQIRLEQYTSPQVAATSLVILAAVLIVLPVLLFLRVVVREVNSVISQFRRGEVTLTELERQVEEATGLEIDLQAAIQQAASQGEVGVLDSALTAFGLVTRILLGLALTLFLLYYFLKDAERFEQWLRATVPLPDRIYEALRREADEVVRAVLISHVFIAVVQGVVAGLGLLVVGIPDAAFWTVVMVFLAVLPIIGSFLVWGPAALYLVVINRPVAAAFLFIYGTIVVGLTDDFLRPIVIDRYTETHLNPSVIILGVLGGVYLIGFVGIFIGPVFIGLLRATLDVYRQEFVEVNAPDSF